MSVTKKRREQIENGEIDCYDWWLCHKAPKE